MKRPGRGLGTARYADCMGWVGGQGRGRGATVHMHDELVVGR